MGAATVEDQTEKRCYKNQTAGHLGVVKLDYKGQEVGADVEPYGTVWLTAKEALLTARAPKRAEDNPFVEQMFDFQDQQGNRVRQGMRPLVLITDDREVPDGDERFVPEVEEDDEQHVVAPDVNLHSIAAGQRDTEATLAREDDRPVATEPSAPVLMPSSGAAVPPSHARATSPEAAAGRVPLEPEEDVRESWVDAPDRTEEPKAGILGGSNEPPEKAPEGDPAKDGSPTHSVQQRPAPSRPPAATSTVESAPEGSPQNGSPTPSESAGTGEANGAPSEQGGQVAEEHAGVTQSGEETGAAETPVGKAPEGEFASHEEVGSPDAPTQGAS